MDALDFTVVPPLAPVPHRTHPYWRMVFLAAGLAADPWAPAVLLDQDKKFAGLMPIPDAAALVAGTWDSLRHAEQDIADEGQPWQWPSSRMTTASPRTSTSWTPPPCVFM